MRERLQKILSRAGISSRRGAEEMLAAGRVRVNGKLVVRLGTKADPDEDEIRVDGRPIPAATRRRVTIALNKPRACVSTRKDPEGRRTVMDLIRRIPERLYPVGRLDYDAEGLLLMTNDGDLAYRLLRPGSVERLYRVKVRGQPDPARLGRLRDGVMLDGKKTLPARVRTIRSGQNTWVEVALHEGRKNQLVRMFRAIGHPVQRIRRIAIGPIGLGSLSSGGYRSLTKRELSSLREACRPVPRKAPAHRRGARTA